MSKIITIPEPTDREEFDGYSVGTDFLLKVKNELNKLCISELDISDIDDVLAATIKASESE